MIHYGNGIFEVENVSELPSFDGVKELFCDVETKRVFDHDKLGGMYPWKGDRICGFSFSFDDNPKVFYVPVRHTAPGARNLPVEPVMKWAADLLAYVPEWINHNIKFDAMFFAVGDGVFFKNRIIDTLTLCKLHYSDRMNYKLKDITADWLDFDTSAGDRVAAYLDSIKSRNYADVPQDILGRYAGDDVRQNRMLYRYLQEKRPAEMAELWETEIKFTPILFDMEYDGMEVDIQQCRIEQYRALKRMIQCADTLARITGTEFTNSNDCIYDLLINQMGLPVLATIQERGDDGFRYDTGRPTFDKDAMELYRSHPLVVIDPERLEVVDNILRYRDDAQFNSLFLTTFLELNVDGVVHPNYNQCVRTGRLSCSQPNSQQQNKRSKRLIRPRKGRGYTSNDYSQIEYRLIVHYCKDEKAILQYNTDPLTDFHQWVADMIHIIRKDAKTLNFGMAYGEGKKSVVHKLTTNPQIIAEMSARVKDIADPKLREVEFMKFCEEHALSCFDAYHTEFPLIKKTSWKASRAVKERGYIFNVYGRRRHLPDMAAHKAFNSLIQGCAADIMKERMVAISPRYNSDSRDFGLTIAANVHDELLQEAPLETLYDERLHRYICDLMEAPKVQFRVPIRVGLGVSPNNWSEAAGDKVFRDADGRLIAGKIR